MATSRSKGPDLASRRLAAERAAAARTRIADEQRRRRLITVAAAVAAVVVIAAVLVVIKVVGGSDGPASGPAATPASAAVTGAISGVPASVFDQVGLGDARSAPRPIDTPALTANGLPRVLYVGAEWCPYCAAERWPLAVALARFGTFRGLGEVRSAPNDGDLATISFHGATYTSRYLAFTGKEIQSNQVDGDHHKTLDTLSSADRTLFTGLGNSQFPFVDLGGTRKVAAQYDPSTLSGKTQDQIAAAIANPKTTIGQSVVGSANLLSAALCSLTKNQPASVCTSSGVRKAAAALPTTP